jgi:uncharacterized protein YndB with AHSA1/START domain
MTAIHSGSLARTATTVVAIVSMFCLASANAEVLSAAPGGFEVRETEQIAAPPQKAFDALLTPQHWWSSEHTYSHDAANLTLDARAGGCWCEKLADGGSVQHLVIVNIEPGKLLRLRGALGPLQGSGVDGALTWTIAPAATGSTITLTYAVGGYMKDGVASVAAPVDSVLGEQLKRLKTFIETGSPVR